MNREKRKSFWLSSCPCVFSLTLRVHQVLFFTGLKVEPRTFALGLVTLCCCKLFSNNYRLFVRPDNMYALDDYHGWFKQSAMRWFDIAQVKAKERIRKAVELDQVRSLLGHVQQMTSDIF